MKLRLFLGLISSINVAEALTISYGPANELILAAENCETLLTQQDAICRWRKTNEPAFLIPALPKLCRKNATGQYSLTVSSCLPDFVKANQNKKNYRNGANCWGTAMSFKKLSTRPRFIWSNEMTYWLNSPLCRKLNPGEEKKPGDIINMYGPESIFQKEVETNKGYRFWEALYPGRFTKSPVDSGYSGYHHFLHAETYLSSELSFGKDSPSKDDKFRFNRINEVYGRSRETECQENQSLSPYLRENQNPPKEIRGSKCAYFSLAYRCEQFPEYFSLQALTEADQGTLAQVRKLQATQDKLFPLLMVLQFPQTNSQVEQLLRLSDEAAAESLAELGRSKINKNREMLLVLHYFTASGIRKSLELADLAQPTEEQ